MSSRDFDAVVDKVALAQSVAKLSPYFQLSTARDLAETLALQAIQGFTSTIPNEQLRPPREITNLIKKGELRGKIIGKVHIITGTELMRYLSE